MYINSLETYAIGLLWPEDDNELLYPDTGRCRGIFIFNHRDGSPVEKPTGLTVFRLKKSENRSADKTKTPGARDNRDGLDED